VDRGERQLPIAAQYVGATLSVPAGKLLRLARDERGKFFLRLSMRNPQLNGDGTLRHLLTIEGLPREVLVHILDTAASFIGVTKREVKKVPLLRGKSVFNLFFEASTRTRYHLRDRRERLSADVIQPETSPCRLRPKRDLLRHGRQPFRDVRGHVRRAAFLQPAPPT